MTHHQKMTQGRARAELDRHRSHPLDRDKLTRYADNFYRECFDNPEGSRLENQAKAIVNEYVVPEYVRASLLAKRHQRLHRRAGLLAYSLAALSVACVAVAVLAHAVATVAFVIEALLLMGVLLVITGADRSRSHARWVENRVLAERMRTMVFMTACGVAPIAMLPPQPLAGTDRRSAWIGLALEEAVGAIPPGSGRTCALEHRVAFARSRWIGRQISFHSSLAASAQRMSRRLERAGFLVFLLALAAALAHVAMGLTHRLHDARTENVLTFLALTLPAAGAALEGIRSHREFSRVARRSLAMSEALSHIDTRLAQVESEDAFEQCLRDAEELLVREVEDWLLLMRTVELKVVA